MVRDTVAFLAGRGAAGLPRRRALLRRLRRRPRLRARGRAGRARGRRRGRRAVRHQRRHAAAPGRRRRRRRRARRPAPGSASTATTTPAAPSPTRWPPSTPGATHVQGTVNGYGERTGNADLLTVVANLQLKQGLPLLEPHRARRRRRASPTRSAEVTNVPAYSPPALRRGERLRAQGRACTRARSRSTPTSTSTWTPSPSATTCGCWCPTWPAAPASSSRRASSGFDLDRPTTTTLARPGRSPGSRSSSCAATPSTPPTRRSSCCCAREVDGAGCRLLRGRVVAGHHRRPRRRRGAVRGDRQARRGRASGSSRTGEGNGPVNALDHALRSGAGDGLPRDRQARADRLQGAHPRRRPRHRRRHPGAHRDLRRHDVVDDHRRRRQHPRGVAGRRSSTAVTYGLLRQGVSVR